MLSHTIKVNLEVMPASERGSFIIPRVGTGLLVKDFKVKSQGVIKCDKPLSCTKLFETMLTQLPESKKQTTWLSRHKPRVSTWFRCPRICSTGICGSRLGSSAQPSPCLNGFGSACDDRSHGQLAAVRSYRCSSRPSSGNNFALHGFLCHSSNI